MTETQQPLVSSGELAAQKQEELAAAFQERYFEAVLGAQLIQTAFIGVKLGWYTALAKAGDKGLYPSELAKQTSCSSPRYAREWLEQQTMAGWVHESINSDIDSNDEEKKENMMDPNDQRRFFLPAAHIPTLADPNSSMYMAPLAFFHGATGKALDKLVDAYRDDTGVSWKELGHDAHEAQARQNRPFFRNELPGILQDILRDDDATLLDRLQNGTARVADIGGGHGFSAIAVAEQFPGATVDIYDLDQASIAAAKMNIRSNGLSNRISANCVDAATVLEQNCAKNEESSVSWDLVMALECIHDMGDPISVLRTMREMALTGTSQGTVIVMDEPAADHFSSSNQNNPLEQFLYGVSCLCCLPDGKSSSSTSKPSVETGAVMRPSLLRMYAQQAGFRDIEKLDAKTDMFHFYKLKL